MATKKSSGKKSSKLIQEPRELITIAELARRTGMSDPAIRARISTGKWVENVHFYRKGRSLRMDPEAIKRFWYDQKQ